MKTKSAFLIGCSAIVVILIGAFLAGYLLFRGKTPTTISSDSWLVLDLKGEIPDYNEIRSSGFWGYGNPSVEEICGKITRSGEDGRIKGIIIKPSGAYLNYANLNEINAALQKFRKSGKPVLAHGVMLGQTDYLLCSLADKVQLAPTAAGGIILEGVSANMMFYKEALDKLGIKMHVMQSGEFKGAGEPYTQTSLSPGTEANLRRVLKARYDLLQADIAAARNLDSTAVRNIFETRPDLIVSAAEAVKYGLADKTGTWDDFLAENKIGKKRLINLKDYPNVPETPTAGDKIAVLNLNGVIGGDEGFMGESGITAAKVETMLEAIREDGKVKAVVLRVNSPGGSASESEAIYQKLKKLDIPVVVSMGGIAASGGYYISCAGDHIVADPHTITGSIGVIMTLPEATGLGDKLGLDSQTLSYGKFAGFGSIFEPYDPELLNSLSRNSASVYTEFKQRVMDSRKISEQDISAVAEGRVFSARDAKDLKLIDEIGDLDAAIRKAAELGKTSRYSVQHFPRRISMLEMFRKAGYFNMASKLLAESKLSPAEQLENQLRKRLATHEWLYFCPFKLD